MSTARKPAPEIPVGLEWFNTTGPVSLTDARGRLLLLEFTGSSLVPCALALGELDRLGYRYRDDLTIVCVHVPVFIGELKRSHVQKFINRMNIRFPVIHDPDHQLLALFGVRQLPAHVLIDRDGCVVGAMNGADKFDRLKKVIDHQLSLRSGRTVARRVPFRKRALPEPAGVLRFPGRIALARGRVYLSDSGHHRILILSPDGHVIRQYGEQGGGFVDGIGAAAAFRNPQGLAMADDFLYVADTGNHAIRRINLQTDEVETIAGNGTVGGNAPGRRQLPPAIALNTPVDVVLQDGRLFIAMAGLHQIWALSLLTNTLEVFAGTGNAGVDDGRPSVASFAQPVGLTVSHGRIYCADALSSAVRSIDPLTGYVSTLVRGEAALPDRRQDLPAKGAGLLQYPQAIVADPVQRLLWVTDTYNDQLCRIGMDSRHVSRLVLDRRLDEPAGLAFADNTLYIANTNAHEILRVDPDRGRLEALNVSEDDYEV